MFRTLISHKEIEEWAKSLKGKPEIIDAPDAGSDKIGLRINFAGKGDQAMLTRAKQAKVVDWATFFRIFDTQKLALVIDSQANGDQTSVYRFIKRTNLNDSDKVRLKEYEQALDIQEIMPQKNKDGLKRNEPDESGENTISGDNPDPESDDDVLKAAHDVGLHPDQTDESV